MYLKIIQESSSATWSSDEHRHLTGRWFTAGACRSLQTCQKAAVGLTLPLYCHSNDSSICNVLKCIQHIGGLDLGHGKRGDEKICQQMQQRS